MTPSTARTIAIGGPSITARYGIMPPGPAYRWPDAGLGAFLDYHADVSGALDEGDTIVAAELSTAPSGDGELIPAFLSVCGNIVSWWGYGGIAGRLYKIRITLQTAGLRIISLTAGVAVDRDLATWPLLAPPNPGFGTPLTWSEGTRMLGPAITLAAVTAVATGTTQLGAAPIPLAKVLVNSGPGGGVLLPPSSRFCGATMPVFNRTGGELTIYPHAGDTIESNGANAGVTIQHDQTAHFSVAESGLLIFS